MKRISLAVLLSGGLAVMPPALLADHHTNADSITKVSLNEGVEKPSNAMGAAKGCAAGAVAGTVIPGLGNIIGCAIGGVFGWFW